MKIFRYLFPESRNHEDINCSISTIKTIFLHIPIFRINKSNIKATLYRINNLNTRALEHNPLPSLHR